MANKKKVVSNLLAPNVMIGIGCQSEVKAKTMHSIACNIIASKGVVSDILMRQGGDIVSARTWVIREALAKGATHVLFVDSDMLFPAEALNKLLALNKDIVGVEYNKRKFPLEPTHKPLTTIEIATEDNVQVPYKCEYVGTGLMLVNLSIFKTMTEPWFLFGRDKEGQVVLGEDVWFCKTAQDCGFEVWCDPSLRVGHMGDYTY